MLKVEVIGLQQFQADVNRAHGNIEPLMKAALQNSAMKIQSEVRSRAPHKTGTLQRSVQAQVSHPHAIVSVNAKHGVWIEKGTRAHEIEPVRAGALYWKGADHPVMRVLHPGTKPRPFFEPGVKAALSAVTEQFSRVASTIISQLK